MKGKLLLGILAILLTVTLLLPLSCARPSADVVAGSSLIASIVQDVADGKLEARTLVPPGMCPGHYDVKPGDVETLANSQALIIHKWQQNMKNVTGLVEAANNPNLIIEVIDVKGNWMAPPVQAEAVDKIAQALCKIDAENAAYYQQRAKEREQTISAKGKEAQNKLRGAEIGEVKVICSEMQVGFAKWAGFDVVATYGRPEEMSAAEVKRLMDEAKQAGVALVIDNLQSGDVAASKAMAKDIGAVQVTISNFPGGFEKTETWEKAVDKNVDLLLQALAQWRQHG
ncbi:MAG: metal ABC transporter substrate-binding protein [Chloroflexota bacterium]|nr:metal ABC transporter substrate-binding protein [Chloroflexota bacterium]